MTLAELIGPNLILNKTLLHKAGIKNYIIPFLTSQPNTDLYLFNGLRLREFNLFDINLGILTPNKNIRNAHLWLWYVNDISEERLRKLIQNTYTKTDIRDLTELKIELL